MSDHQLHILTTNGTVNDNVCICYKTYTTINHLLLRLVIDVANYHHTCYMEIFDKNNVKWNRLFTHEEIANYNAYSYICRKDEKLKFHNENLEKILSHFDKVYWNTLKDK